MQDFAGRCRVGTEEEARSRPGRVRAPSPSWPRWSMASRRFSIGGISRRREGDLMQLIPTPKPGQGKTATGADASLRCRSGFPDDGDAGIDAQPAEAGKDVENRTGGQRPRPAEVAAQPAE